MPEDQLREVIEGIRTHLHAELQSQLGTLSERHDQAIERARQAAEAEADQRWAQRVDATRAEWAARLESEVAAARSEVERTMVAESIRVRVEAEQQVAESASEARREIEQAVTAERQRAQAQVDAERERAAREAESASEARRELEQAVAAERQRAQAQVDAERERAAREEESVWEARRKLEQAVAAERQRAQAQMDAERERAARELTEARAAFEAERTHTAEAIEDAARREIEQAVAAERQHAQAQVDAERQRAEAQVDAERQRAGAQVDAERERAARELTEARAAFEAERTHTAEAIEDAARLAAAASPSGADVSSLLEAVRAIDGASSLSDALAAAVRGAAAEAPRAALFLVTGQDLAEWPVGGVAPVHAGAIRADGREAGILGEAVRRGEPIWTGPGANGINPPAFAALADGSTALASPVVLAGQPVAVLYADDGVNGDTPKAWRDTVQILARHATAAVAYLTAVRTAQALQAMQALPLSSAAVPAAASTEDEHGARRYARLLVSEIKLYNEGQVRLGRERRDLLQRLKPEIDRARVLYEERISVAIGARDMYFREELLQTLAGGDQALLGSV